ncbi:hypothetical protein DTL42_11125 [Bremerella cremea]|uniref:Uncharacterized protein n=1 Tax=Bremerella cremea TaxID=1031537 RepID=A0A368KS29_9BACT|nr:hypothetical protein [Bremerella cremea]RCS50646.1 hypothetical protein DTL42_11125 [Bremerella cremea]
MPLRTMVVLLSFVCCLPGCQTWGWGWKSAPPVEEEERLVDDFTNTQAKSDDSNDEAEPTSAFAKKNGRASDPGTGLSDRSRDIERSLGYR